MSKRKKTLKEIYDADVLWLKDTVGQVDQEVKTDSSTEKHVQKDPLFGQDIQKRMRMVVSQITQKI